MSQLADSKQPDQAQYDMLNQSNVSLNKSRAEGRRTPTSARRGGNGNRSQMDISIDHEYLGKVDQMEQQNQNYIIEIEKMRSLKQAETQKVVLLQKEVDGLHQRIAELEMANQKNENLGSEKQRQLEYEIQMKEQQVQVLGDQVKSKQGEFQEKILKLEEELEIEKENGVKLQAVTNQRDKFQKVIAGLQEGME